MLYFEVKKTNIFFIWINNICLFFSSKCQINIIEKYVKNILLNYNIYYIKKENIILYNIVKKYYKKDKKSLKLQSVTYFG